jgi:hypothetical protein
MKMFRLVPLAQHVALDEVLNELCGGDVVERCAETVQGLLDTFMPGAMGSGQNCQP